MQSQNARRVGSLFKIPLFLDPSWFLIVIWITVTDGLQWQSRWGAPVAYGAGLAMALLLFGSVLLHELGHSLVAQRQGIKVNSITLFLFGGVAAIEDEPKTPGQMFQVAVAGPLMSLALFLLFGGIAWVAPLPNSTVGEVAALLLTRVASLNAPGWRANAEGLRVETIGRLSQGFASRGQEWESVGLGDY
jgi:Zn-dependent protease